jgi:hypothetical protein
MTAKAAKQSIEKGKTDALTDVLHRHGPDESSR